MVDAELIARAAAGDSSAFQALVEQHRSMVYRVAYQFAGNHYDAEDIAQEVFIKVYRSLSRFRQDCPVHLVDLSNCHERLHRSSPPAAVRGRAVRRPLRRRGRDSRW